MENFKLRGYTPLHTVDNLTEGSTILDKYTTDLVGNTVYIILSFSDADHGDGGTTFLLPCKAIISESDEYSCSVQSIVPDIEYWDKLGPLTEWFVQAKHKRIPVPYRCMALGVDPSVNFYNLKSSFVSYINDYQKTYNYYPESKEM